MAWILWFVIFGIALVALATLTMFMGHGHLDEHNTEQQHLDEVEIFSRNIHF